MVFRWSSFRIVSDDPGYQPRWPPLLKIENLAKNHLKIISSETAGPIGPKLWWNGLLGDPLSELCPTTPAQPRWLPLLKIENSAKNHLKIIFSETAGPIGPKLWWNGLQMVLFQNCVRRPRLPTKMATVTKNRKFGKKSLKNYLL